MSYEEEKKCRDRAVYIVCVDLAARSRKSDHWTIPGGPRMHTKSRKEQLVDGSTSIRSATVEKR